MQKSRLGSSNRLMPAEWAQHDATWMSWPFDDEMWHGHLNEVRREYTALVRNIARHEAVHLLVRDQEARQSAEAMLGDIPNLSLHDVPLDDVWLRDNGPIFVYNEQGLEATNWQFNSWGQKYSWELDNLAPYPICDYLGITRIDIPVVMEGGSLEVNGLGTALTTEQCLLSPMRNPGMSREEIADYLKKYLGIEQVIWLHEGLEGDHTDGHIDTITRFAGPHTILTSVCDDPKDPNFKTMGRNLAILKESRNLEGRPFEIIELPLPKNRYHLADGTRLPATYANFYICNGAVLVPQYDDPNDSTALELIGSSFSEHKVIGLPSRFIITGGGSFHCLTQQQPRILGVK